MTAIRPFDLRQDLDAMVDLIEIAFADDEARMGQSFRDELQSIRKVLPLLFILEHISDNFRHSMDGFVCEDQGRIVALVNILRAGLNKKRWEIGNVATHPEYRGKGLARQLVNRAVEHARQYGAEICVLDVRDDNQPAYKLYESLGFLHYDSNIDLKLETLPQVQTLPLPDGYSLRTMKYTEWQPRYALAMRETPASVQEFLPVNISDYRVMPIERVVQPLAMRLQKMDAHRLAVEKDGKMAGYLSLMTHRISKLSHRLFLRVDPQHRQELTEPLLTLALEKLQAYPQQNVLTSVRKDNQLQREILKKYGFEEVFVMHRMGLKLTAE
jgi:ribosomal protein S18 acetylase RimI-like enzyme